MSRGAEDCCPKAKCTSLPRRAPRPAAVSATAKVRRRAIERAATRPRALASRSPLFLSRRLICPLLLLAGLPPICAAFLLRASLSACRRRANAARGALRPPPPPRPQALSSSSPVVGPGRQHLALRNMQPTLARGLALRAAVAVVLRARGCRRCTSSRIRGLIARPYACACACVHRASLHVHEKSQLKPSTRSRLTWCGKWRNEANYSHHVTPRPCINLSHARDSYRYCRVRDVMPCARAFKCDHQALSVVVCTVNGTCLASTDFRAPHRYTHLGARWAEPARASAAAAHAVALRPSR